ncbi:GNAT family N-acetyltransferase [Leptothermofonsia sp. ETS-13]|uniref:GNAT family N-acetyltransferase n=1 Tax=Leptothermofonsia sp. ETS-13 TaxID=3035696 RepID=UPI003B9F4E33
MSTFQPSVESANHLNLEAKYHEQAFPTEPLTKQVKPVALPEQERAIATIVLAFSADPAARWIYPNTQQYLTYFPQFVRVFGGKAFKHGTAYSIEDYSGAALWFPPGVEPDEEPLMALLQESIFESDQADRFALFEQMGHYHPREPHWYLPLIGVEPVQQGRGYGSALMQHVLMQCDRDRIPAYLEASKPANIPFYERHGFKVLCRIQVAASPPIFPMMRLPG